MTGIAVLQGPAPPEDCPLGFCLVCAGVGRFIAFKEIEREVAEHERSGTGVKRWVLKIPPHYLQRAVAWSLIQSMGICGPVCWTHASPIQPIGGGVIPVQGGLPAGLGGDGSNIPLLGGPH